MSENCKECAKKSKEIEAIRNASDGLRAKIRAQDLEYRKLEAEALSQFADYDEKLSKLRRVVAGHMAASMMLDAEKSAQKVAGPASPG